MEAYDVVFGFFSFSTFLKFKMMRMTTETEIALSATLKAGQTRGIEMFAPKMVKSSMVWPI